MNGRLSDFEAMFDPVVLERGRVYHAEGRVMDIEETDTGEYRAAVEGSEVYEVYIALDERHGIREIKCDCPFDWDDHCKHQAAVLFALREQLLEGGAKATSKTPPLLMRVRDVLAKQPKEALLDALLAFTRENPVLGDRLLRQFGGEAGAKSLVDAMWAAVGRAKGVGRRHAKASAEEAATCIQHVLDTAREEKKASLAVALLFQVINASQTMVDLSYENEYECGWLTEVAVGNITALVEGCAADGDDMDREALYTALFDGIRDLPFRNWDDRLVECALPLCGLPACRQQVDEFFEKRLRELAGRQADYMVSHIKKLQFSLIQRFDGEQRAEQFIQSNLQYTDFRELAIEAAMKKREYRAALSLALEGGKKDKDLPGLLNQWRRHAFDAYKALADIPNARKLARAFLLDGDFKYYAWLKQSYTTAEWADALAPLLVDLETKRFGGRVYEQVLIAEELWDKLMTHVERTPARIFDLRGHLADRYADRVDAAFHSAIIDIATRAADRSAYYDLCLRIQVYGSVCGQRAADKIIRQLREKYPRKRAFMDELTKAFS